MKEVVITDCGEICRCDFLSYGTIYGAQVGKKEWKYTGAYPNADLSLRPRARGSRRDDDDGSGGGGGGGGDGGGSGGDPGSERQRLARGCISGGGGDGGGGRLEQVDHSATRLTTLPPSCGETARRRDTRTSTRRSPYHDLVTLRIVAPVLNIGADQSLSDTKKKREKK